MCRPEWHQASLDMLSSSYLQVRVIATRGQFAAYAVMTSISNPCGETEWKCRESSIELPILSFL